MAKGHILFIVSTRILSHHSHEHSLVRCHQFADINRSHEGQHLHIVVQQSNGRNELGDISEETNHYNSSLQEIIL